MRAMLPLFSTLALVFFAALVPVDEKRESTIEDTTRRADFASQGEYLGMLNVEGRKVKFGAQVVALGRGHFRVSAGQGGLPGEGGVRDEGFLRGVRRNNVVRVPFVNGRGSMLVASNELRMVFGSQTVAGILKKVNRRSATLGRRAPKGASVLFNGSVADWDDAKVDKDAALLSGTTKTLSQDKCKVHLEFRLPFAPVENPEDRKPGGVYLAGEHKIAVVDSFGLVESKDSCGAIGGVTPTVNMCFPPGAWQTMYIDYYAAKLDGKRAASTKISLKLNGILVQDNVEIRSVSRIEDVNQEEQRSPAVHIPENMSGVQYRNIWMVTESR
jgi:hypothetical protein